METNLNRAFLRIEEGKEFAVKIEGAFFVRPRTANDRFDPKPACRAIHYPNWPKTDGAENIMLGVNNLCKGVIEQAQATPEWYLGKTFKLTMGVERPGRSRLWDVKLVS